MKTNKISFGTWYRMDYKQLKNLSPEEAVRLGVTLGKFKTNKDIYSGLTGLAIDIQPKKEHKFMEICDSYDILPSKEKI